MSNFSNTQNNFYSSQANPESYPFTSNNNKLTIYSNTKLWQPNQTSLNFISPRLSFNRQKRFKLQSIYWPQNIEAQNLSSTARLNKQRSDADSLAKVISKKIDEEEKNLIRIKKQNSNSSGVNEQHQQNKLRVTWSQSNKKKQQSLKSERKRFVLDQKNEKILKRLILDSPRKQSLLRDRFGFRSNLVEGQDNDLSQKVKDEVQADIGFSSKGFKTSSLRKNLNLPLNYYPGPGTYEAKGYFQHFGKSKENPSKRAVTARQTISKKQ